MKPKHNILIVGCGSIGERHLRCFQATGRANVFACDADPSLLQRIKLLYNVTTFPDYTLALHEPIDAVVICTPAHLHLPMARQAFRQRKHVLIEKPLSQSFKGVEDLLQEWANSGCQAAVAYVLHAIPFLIEARDFLRSGELGHVAHVTLTSGQPFHRLRPAHAVHYSQTYYRDRKTGGGAIQDALTHSANWVESVIGPTESVLCDCDHQVLPGVTVEDTVNISARHGRVLVNYTLNQFQVPNETTLQFNTANGSVKIELHKQRWGVFRENDTDWTWHEAPTAERDIHFLNQALFFIDQIQGKPSRLCSLQDAVHTLRFNLAALASAEANARVMCASIHD